MSKSSVRLVTDNPPRTLERDQLAQAIARVNEATKRIADIATALQRATDELFGERGLTRAVERAEKAHEEALAGENTWLADAALGRTDASLPPAQEAAAALEAAKAALDQSKRVRDALEQEQQEVGRELINATNERNERLRAVVQTAPETQRLIADHKVALQTYTVLQRQMAYLGTDIYLPSSSKFWQHVEPSPELEQAHAKWAQAIDAMKADADAALPS